MELTSSRSKFYYYNTMVCLLKSLERKKITVELRNNIFIEGVLDFVNSAMDLNMSQVTLTGVYGRTSIFSQFYVKGRHILFVMIPDEVDILNAMKWQIEKADYFKDKERRQQAKTFQRIQKGRAKAAEKWNRQEQKFQ